MDKINEFTYQKDGLIILFEEENISNELPKKYSFKIKDNDELSEKIFKAVKNKTVPFKGIFYCARAIFALIEENIFDPLIDHAVSNELFEKYQMMHEKSPEFIVKNISEDSSKPMFLVTLNHNEAIFAAQSRAVSDAKARALKVFFEETLSM